MRRRRRVERWRHVEVLALEDVADVLNLSTGHVYRLAEAGRLPVTITTDGPRRVQRVVRTADLVAYLEAQDDGQLALFGDPDQVGAPAAPSTAITPPTVETTAEVAARGAAEVRAALRASR